MNVSGNEDIARGGSLVAGDPNGDILTYSGVGQASQANYNGSDSFAFRVNDGTVNSNTIADADGGDLGRQCADLGKGSGDGCGGEEWEEHGKSFRVGGGQRKPPRTVRSRAQDG